MTKLTASAALNIVEPGLFSTEYLRAALRGLLNQQDLASKITFGRIAAELRAREAA